MPDFLQDMKLKLDPAFMPPEPAKGPLPSLVPPLRLGPQPPAADLSTTGPTLPPPDLFSNYADPPAQSQGGTAMGALDGFVKGLGNGPGVQVDKNGIGATLDDWKLRFMPYIPFLNEP